MKGLDRARVAVMATGACAFLEMYVTQALLPELRRVFDASIGAVSLTVTVTTLAVALVAPFAGGLADRHGRKPVLLAAIALLAVATAGSASAGSLDALLVWRALQGAVIPGIFASAVAYIAEEWPPAEAGGVASLYIAGAIFGGFCGRFIAGLITAAAGWRVAFLVLGALNLAVLGIVTAWLPRSRAFSRARSWLDSLAGIGGHLRNPPLRATYAIGFALLFSLVGSFTYIDFYLSAAPFELGTHELSFIFFVYLVGMAVTPMSGTWALRYGVREVGLAALAVSGAGLLLTLIPRLPVVIAGLALGSLGVFITQSLATATVPRLASAARSSAVGLYLTCYYLGGSAGASLPAALWPLGGWPSCVALILAVQSGAAFLVSRFWPEH